jgi:hypothetical protein
LRRPRLENFCCGSGLESEANLVALLQFCKRLPVVTILGICRADQREYQEGADVCGNGFHFERLARV